MGQRSTKHSREQVIRQSDFSGGLNLLVSPEALAENELSQAENWEFAYPTNKLQTREGLTLIKNVGVDIDTLFYADNHDAFYFSSSGWLYEYVNGVVTNLGELTGTDVPKFTLWGNKILIASGQSLQSYDSFGALTDTGSPDADIVFTRVGRVVIAKTGSDTLIYSGVGDEENWSVGNDGDSIEIDIGYQDGGDIISIEPLATDIVVFKSSGGIFRVAGEFPDWAVYEITRSQSAFTRFATVQFGNDVFFLSGTGFMSLNAVQEYGNVKTSMEGFKINSALVAVIDAGARIWSLPSKGQIWVRTQNTNYIWVYHTLIKAWTKFKMHGEVTGQASLDDGSEYISIGQGIYKLEGETDDGVDIECFLKTKRYVARNEYLLKRLTLHYYGVELESKGSMTVGLMTKNFLIPRSGDIAFSDDDVAYSDDDVLVAINYNKIDARTSYRTSEIELFVHMTKGSLLLKELILNVVEV